MTDQAEEVWRVDQIAFEIWTWKAQRSDKETLRQLHELGPEYEVVTIKDIRKWRQAYSWATLADDATRRLAPAIHNETLGGMIIAGLKAQRVLDGLLESWSEHKVIPPKNVISMLDVTFKYAGLSPTGIRDPTEKARSGRGGVVTSAFERYFTKEEREQFLREDDEAFELPEVIKTGESGDE